SANSSAKKQAENNSLEEGPEGASFPIENGSEVFRAFARVPQDHAIPSDGPAILLITEHDGAQRRGGAASVALPNSAAVFGVKDDAVQPNGPRVFHVRGPDPQQIARNAADLNSPGGAAVRGVQDQPFLSHGPAVFRVGERNRIEPFARAAFLRGPGRAAICG